MLPLAFVRYRYVGAALSYSAIPEYGDGLSVGKAQVSDQLLSAVVPLLLIAMVAPNWLVFCGEIV